MRLLARGMTPGLLLTAKSREKRRNTAWVVRLIHGMTDNGKRSKGAVMQSIRLIPVW